MRVIQSIVVEMQRGWEAFSIHPPNLPNPSLFFANASSTGSLIKNSINVVQAIISDVVIVSHVYCKVQGGSLTNVSAGVSHIYCLER